MKKKLPIREPLTNKEAIELNDELYKMSQELYLKDSSHGDLLFKFLTRLRANNEKAYEILSNYIFSIDPNISDKNSLIQKITINKVLISYLLTIAAVSGIDVSNALTGCDNGFKEDVWLDGVFELVLPVILNNLDI